ncbi:hypothetical protein P389DRAFT_50745 [Cystobasidium minutum MCA 4210]|uniref:uncharacterized protein n=1 Tax=Cystobasidium minutum MCA 4210 TaxID=1397322 RepID=UPI0034CF53DA|eukprot:jgi/Rhomi1/50745/CE50744_228
MVAVSLSQEVRPLPLMEQVPAPAAAAAQEEVGGTTTSTTGIESVDDHIARLKANARQHVERDLNGSAPHSQSKSPYLPSKEIAKTIKCRFFPNCYYGDKCMFYHPSSLAEAASHQVVMPSMQVYQPMIVPGANGSIYADPQHSLPNGVQSPASNGDANLPLSPNGVNGIPEEYSNGYDMGYNPNAPPNGYYIPAGYENGSEYNPYAQQGQQQQQQGGSSQQQQNNGQYYGFVPYGVPPHAGGYAPYAPPHANGYYPQGNYQGMYMSPPPAPAQQFGSLVHQQNGSVNGVMSPASSSNAPIAADPAIIAQGPESTSAPNGQESASAETAPNGVNGEEAPRSAGMEKSSSNQSGKSTSSSKSKKAKKAAAAAAASANGVNGAVEGQANGADSTPLQQQAQEFIPMQYYGMPAGMPMMPSEMMMMMPPPHAQAHHMHQGNGMPHFQPQAYGSFPPQMTMNGNLPENGVTSPAAAAGAALLNGSANGQDKKAHVNGHERIPSLTNGQLHTFFQTSGEAVPSSSSASQSNGRPAPRANGGPASASTAANGASTNGRFNPSSSTNGSGGPVKRFPPSQFSPTGAPLPRSGPVSNPNHIRGGSRTFDPTSAGAKPTLPCRYFESRSCRHGDLCHYTHLLIEERAIPNSGSEGTPARMTRDARLLGLNIGSPDGRISDTAPKHPADFAGAAGHHASNGRRMTLNGHNGSTAQAPNGFGMPNVNAKGRFVHAAQPSSQGFAAHQQQQQAQSQPQQAQTQAQQEQKQQQIAALAGSNSADAQEKIQRLISETRNLPSSIPPPATAAQNGPRSNGPRSSAPHPGAQALGGRRPPHQGGASRGPHGPASHSHATSQRVPSGEKDFPALSSSSNAGPASATSMERSASSTSSADKKTDSKEIPPIPAAAATETKKEETPAQAAQTAAPATSAPSPAATPAATPAPAAPAKPAFSWASAAAKAASLPTPPPKKPAPKARASGKETKAEKAEKKEKQQKDKEGSAAAAPPATKTAASVVAAAAPSTAAETPVVAEPVAAAA